MNSHAKPNAPAVPSAYIKNINPALVAAGTASPGNSVAIISRYTGKRAEQLISGATRMVTRRSFAFSMVRVAMIPGIAHAYEPSSGMNDLPCNPTRLIGRSISAAARAI